MVNKIIGRFFNYIEIQTKITSFFSFMLTIAFMTYNKNSVNWKLTLVFFASMFIFDLTTTAINNYIDTKTNGLTLAYKRSTARMIIFIMLGISTGLGLYLAYQTDLVVFLIGGLCFLCGIFYTFGPIPISRLPLGEIFSGLFYGLMIPFLLLYINLPKGSFLTLNVSLETINLNINVSPVITIALLSIIPMCTTANIMLANNICDVKKDIQTKRYTLPYYLGNKALYLFAGIYYLAYLDIIFMVSLKLLSPLCLIALLTIFIVQKNITLFLELQNKATTFILSVQNYIIIMGAITILIFLSALVS